MVRNGIRIEPPEATEVGSGSGEEGPIRLTCGGRLVAVARITDGLLRTEVVLQVIE